MKNFKENWVAIFAVVLVAVVVTGGVMWGIYRKSMDKAIAELEQSMLGQTGHQGVEVLEDTPEGETVILSDNPEEDVEYFIMPDGAITIDAYDFDLNQEFDKGLTTKNVDMANAAVKLFLMAPLGAIDREVLEEYYTPNAIKVVSQQWVFDDESMEETMKAIAPKNPQIRDSVLYDDYVNVLVESTNLDSYNVFFKDGKVEAIEYYETIFED